VLFTRRSAPEGMLGGALASMIQPLGTQVPRREASDSLIRADLFFLAIELVLVGLLLLNLNTSSASHAAAASLITSGAYALPFWGVVVGLGLFLPIVWQALELSHRVAHTVVPALLVLAGSFTLRWVMVNAGQLSQIVPVASLGQ
jgi:formate-dependent nitrite reductase membrane component NrfD